MILIVGIESESPICLVREAAKRASIPYVMLNQRKCHLYELSIKHYDNTWDCSININGSDFNLNDFAGVYVRMMDYAFLPEIKNKVYNYIGQRGAEKSLAFHQQFMNWIEIADCRVMNRSLDMLSNMSKPYQLQLVGECGLKVPPTCVTNSENEVIKFKGVQRNIIFKSSSWIRSIVKELNSYTQNSISRVRYLPTQFQKKLIGTNIRVHVVGNDVFATKIKSPVVDYRYSATEGMNTILESHLLPDEINTRCINLSKQLNLPLCGIDLFLTNEGEYYCFEVNPSPGYSYYQENTGQDIASSIVHFLEFGDN
jgi:glutathione synthase/RimK-type ligase-like ATP-grasp enzyme